MTPHSMDGGGKFKGNSRKKSNAPLDPLKPHSIIGASTPWEGQDNIPRIIRSGGPDRPNSPSLKDWRHEIFREFGRFDCYAIFVVLPQDKEAIRYLNEFGKGLDLISGDDCLVITLGKKKFSREEFNLQDWLGLVEEHAREGYSLKFAELFNVKYEEIPCLLVFNDFLAPEHLLVKLVGMEAEEIDKTMRSIFSTIREAISKGEDPTQALQRNRNQKMFLKAGKTIISELRVILGKSIETAVAVLVAEIYTNPKI